MMTQPTRKIRSRARHALTRSQIMSRVGQRDTGPELLLRKPLWASGLRYRVNYRVEGIRVDIAFPGRRLAIFVDGCFWHSCPLHKTRPKTNRSFWAAKFRANRTRDRRQTRTLERAGWTVLRLWEHEASTGFTDAIKVIHRILTGINK
jgi:DNA mismatch endonuclease (patch repair protein)